MFAFIMEEFRDWRERRLKRNLLISTLVLGAAAAASLLQTLVLALAATLLFLGFGWAEGNRYQSSLSARRLLLAFPAGPGSIAAGKALSSLLTWFFTLLFITPPLALSAIAWGLRGEAALACILAWLVAYYLSLCAGFISSLVFVRSDGLPGGALLLAWLLSPLLTRALAPSNPFLQVWDFLKEEGGSTPLLGMLATALAASLLLACSAWILAAKRSSGHG